MPLDVFGTIRQPARKPQATANVRRTLAAVSWHKLGHHDGRLSTLLIRHGQCNKQRVGSISSRNLKKLINAVWIDELQLICMHFRSSMLTRPVIA
jgi:hypothetical protein